MKKIFAVVIFSGSLLWTQQAAAWLWVAPVARTATVIVGKCTSNLNSCVTAITSVGGLLFSYSAKAETRINNAIAENKQKISLLKCPNSNTLYTLEEVREHCKIGDAEVVDVDL